MPDLVYPLLCEGAQKLKCARQAMGELNPSAIRKRVGVMDSLLVALLAVSNMNSIGLHYAHQDGCAEIRLRHRIKAGFVSIDFLVIISLLVIWTIRFPSLRIFCMVDKNIFYCILLLIGYTSLPALCVWLLGKIRNFWIFNLISLCLCSFWVYTIYSMMEVK